MTSIVDSGARGPTDPAPPGPGPGHQGRRRAAAAAALAALAGGLAACGTGASASSPAGCASGAPKITVEANGQASASPDILTITIGVNVSGVTAAAALSDANRQATSLTDTLKLSGVASTDIQSTNFSIDPTYAQNGSITGYQVSNNLLVTLHDLTDAGQVIDKAAASVGNAIRINGLTFAVSNTGNVDGRARAAAVTTAAAHARAMAAAAGESLGGICSVNDSTTGPAPAYFALNGAVPTSGAAGAAVPLEPGTQQATAQVSVVYLIVPK